MVTQCLACDGTGWIDGNQCRVCKATGNTPGRPMSTPLVGKLPRKKKTQIEMYEQGKRALGQLRPSGPAVAFHPNVVTDLLCRSSCNACTREPSVGELRFGDPQRASSILCVSLCRKCAALVREQLETLP